MFHTELIHLPGKPAGASPPSAVSRVYPCSSVVHVIVTQTMRKLLTYPALFVSVIPIYNTIIGGVKTSTPTHMEEYHDQSDD
jgi:hypothetical protein